MEVNLVSKEYYTLELLAKHGELFGLELVELSDGKLKRGQIYLTTACLVANKFITSTKHLSDYSDLPRSKYKITEKGLAELNKAELDFILTEEKLNRAMFGLGCSLIIIAFLIVIILVMVGLQIWR